jgi:hypothetical protein
MPKVPPVGFGFKKGKSGNPRGSSTRKRELSALAKLTTAEVASVGVMLLENNRQSLKDLATDDKESFLKVWTAALMLKGYSTGNPAIYNAILDRIIGKPKEMRELSGPDGAPIAVQALEQSDEEKIERAEKLRQMRIALEGDK